MKQIGEYIIQNWPAWICTAIVPVMSYVFAKVLAIKEGLRALLRDRIIQAYNHYTDKGYYPIYARENVEDMYKQYHSLGGNGTVTDLVSKLKELPTESEEE